MLILPSAVEVCYLCVCICVCVFFSPAPHICPPPPHFFSFGFPVVLFCFLNVLLFWLFEVIGSVSVALSGWKIQCHMVERGDFPISFLFRALSLLLTLLLGPVSRFQLHLHAHLRNTHCQSHLLIWTCLFSFLCVVLGDLFNLVCFNDDF